MGKRSSWRSSDRRKSAYPTDLLFHCSDAHGVHGLLPKFDQGETWTLLHDELHAVGEFMGREPHDHEPSS